MKHNNKLSYFRNYTRQLLSSNIVTMFSLSKERSLLRVLHRVAPKLLRVALTKTKVAPRLRRFNKFLQLMMKFYRHHGAAFTIKWLKACHLAVQRKISSKPCKSLRDIEPNLPCPRLINGLPSFIGTIDRSLIKRNHSPTIRFWLSILSIYRILQGPLNPKLNTISDIFSGSVETINEILMLSQFIKDRNERTFRNLPSISSSKIIKLLTAGPNNPVSFQSIFTDALAYNKYPEVFNAFRDYCTLTSSDELFKTFDTYKWWAEDTIETRQSNSWVKLPKSLSFEDIRLGKLSFKEEAAGKLRVFAIVDIWTQSALEPLHQSLFALLKRLPNDGTFDQNASFERCLEKAQLYNCAYSVDLSAATDRLPIQLQSGIIDLIFNIPGLGKVWADLLVKRPYIIPVNKYGVEQGEIVYGTGQPMGALSSWAMLAVTHHFILQVAAFRVNPSLDSWFSRYEILGDDLVIFDTMVYQEYLSIMDQLKVGTNPSKSLFSEGLTSLEFAKRTGVDGKDVSGLSWKQFISGSSAIDRVSLLIYFAAKGLVTSVPSILNILRASNDHSIPKLSALKERDKSKIDQLLMALLGHFVNSNKLSLLDAVSFTIDPHNEDMDQLENPTVPITVTLHESLKLLNSRLTVTDQGYEDPNLSLLDKRREIAEEHVIGKLSNAIVKGSLSRGLQLDQNLEKLVLNYAYSLVNPTDECWTYNEDFSSRRFQNKGKDIGFSEVIQCRLIAEQVLFPFSDYESFKRELENVNLKLFYFGNSGKYVPNTETIIETSDLSDQIDKFVSDLMIESTSRATTKSSLSWLFKDITKAVKAKREPLWTLPSKFRATVNM